MFDVYLGGALDSVYLNEFKNQISEDISVFDPTVEDYDHLNNAQKNNQVAKELIYMEEESKLIVFYFNSDWQGVSSLIELGDCVGRGKAAIVCLDGSIKGEERIRRYCEFRGIIITDSLEDLITTVEEYMAQVELCSVKI